MYSSTNPNQLKKKEQWLKNTNFIYKGYCHESVQRFSFAKHPHCLRPRPIPVPVFAHTNGYCYKGTQTRATKQIHLCLMLSIRREEKTYLCFRNRLTRTLSSGRGDHEFKLRTVSFSFRDSLILTFVSCSKSFKHPSIETYSIKQTTVNNKKDCKVTLQSFLERVTDLWVRIRFADRKLKSLLTHQLDHARFHHKGVCCAPRITRTNPQILQEQTDRRISTFCTG